MKTCGVCGQLKNTPFSCNVHTLQVLSQATAKTGFKQYTTTTNFGEHQLHTYDVCWFCYIQWNLIFPLIILLVFTALCKIILIPNDREWTGALFFALFPTVYIVWKHIFVSRRLIKKALSEKFGDYVAFNELEYIFSGITEKTNR